MPLRHHAPQKRIVKRDKTLACRSPCFIFDPVSKQFDHFVGSFCIFCLDQKMNANTLFAPHHPNLDKGGWPDEGSCSVFPGKRRIIREIIQISVLLCEAQHQYQSSRPGSTIRQFDKSVPRTVEKPNRRIMSRSCSPWEMLVKANPSRALSSTAPVATKVVRAFPGIPCAPHALWIADV